MTVTGPAAAHHQPFQQISRHEDKLTRALVVLTFANYLNNSTESIQAMIARCFGIKEANLVMCLFGPSSFLQFLPDEMTTMVFHGGQPIISTSHCLHIKHWSRFLRSFVACLLPFVEIELRDIPTHGWRWALWNKSSTRAAGLVEFVPIRRSVEMFTGSPRGARPLIASLRAST